MRRLALPALLLALAVPMSTSAQPSAGIRARPAIAQRAAAFRAAFGSQTTRDVEQWDIVFSPGALIWIGPRAVLVSPGRNTEDCHVCAGALAVHYLAAQGRGFRVTGSWFDALVDGSYGAPPDWRFSRDLSAEPMLRVESGGGNQGIFCTSVEYYAFDPGGLRRVASIPIGYENASGIAPGNGQDYRGRLINIRPGRGFDVAYAGTRRFVEHWVLRGGEYVPAAQTSRMPTC